MTKRARLLGVLWLLLWGAIALAEVPVPALQARVTDLTQTLNLAQREALERDLAVLEQTKGAQLAVLIVPTTQPESIEQYARRVLDVWQLGRKGVDDGALLLVAKDDRKLRIETQYGLEGVIPDAVAKRVISEDITPHFKRGDFYGGIEAGVSRVARLINGEPLPPPPQQAQRKQSGMSFLEDNFVLFAIFVVVFGGLLRSLFGQLLGAGVASGLVAVVVWLVTGSLLFVIITSIITFIVVLVGVGRGGGGWSSGGGGGWSSGGGGGWSGGGGMGGGGGASGSW